MASSQVPEIQFVQGRTVAGNITVAHKPHPKTFALTACNYDVNKWAGIDYIRGSVHTRCRRPACKGGA